MLAREGDLIQTINKVVFDVKGLVHPHDRLIAFPRYIPSHQGKRSSRGELYDKVYNLAERFQYLQQKAPHLIVDDPIFGEKLCEVPTQEITRHYKPIEALATLRKARELQSLEQKALSFADELRNASGIPWSSIGVSGSVMAGMLTPKSDIDPIVYGTKNCRKAYAAMQEIQKTKTTRFKLYNQHELHALFDFRSKDTNMSFEDFKRVETRKAFQGMYKGTDYFVRFVKDWKEVTEHYGDVCYEKAGYAKLSATITDDSEALFTPCTYKIDNVQVLEGPKLDSIVEIASFRGRFCQQAKINEKVLVQGKVENITETHTNRSYHRIIIGNQPADFMVLLES